MREERAVSTALGYILTLSVTAILVSGLLFAGGNFVENERESVTASELEVVGQRLASQLESADRVAQTAGPDGEFETTATLPETVAATPYSVNVSGSDGEHRLRLRTTRPDVTVTTTVRTTLPVENATVSGGRLRIAYNATGDSLEVSDA